MQLDLACGFLVSWSDMFSVELTNLTQEFRPSFVTLSGDEGATLCIDFSDAILEIVIFQMQVVSEGSIWP